MKRVRRSRIAELSKYTVNMKRLQDDILELGNIGRNKKDAGIYRMAFSDADMEGRRWLQDKIKEIGMKTSMDGAGNVFGSFPGNNNRPVVLVGSHLDSVPCGGTLDGALGVLAALECMRVIKEQGIQTFHPVELVAFSDEEGRFGGMFGVQALIGDITPETIFSAEDSDGIKLIEEMQAQNMDPMKALDAKCDPESIYSYLELHIEQGPVLENLQKQIGVVDVISGMFKWAVRLIGKANHSGTTPMNMRNDSFLGLADFAHEIPRVLDENGTEHSRATIGKVELLPGFPHTIPGQVDFTLVVRDTSSKVLDELQDAFRKALSAIARRMSLMFEFDIITRMEPVQMSTEIQKIIEANANKMKLDYQYMPSGAGHDAQFMTKVAHSGLIFVPSKDGQSHSPSEWTDLADIEVGANLLLNSILETAKIKK